MMSVIVDLGKPASGKLSPFNAYVALSRGKGRHAIRILRLPDYDLLTTPMRTPQKGGYPRGEAEQVDEKTVLRGEASLIKMETKADRRAWDSSRQHVTTEGPSVRDGRRKINAMAERRDTDATRTQQGRNAKGREGDHVKTNEQENKSTARRENVGKRCRGRL
ncbi:hypothetical protein BKA62DRAFT_387079 [Auriculariales sp. MPI-PUGE-AT-0066]|nr:hypothetical protein BKA62DRAFT_387079 [Auriculariales sp. MPI-PUGE-AT-0066]